jgi:hypothetical protein
MFILAAFNLDSWKQIWRPNINGLVKNLNGDRRDWGIEQ